MAKTHQFGFEQTGSIDIGTMLFSLLERLRTPIWVFDIDACRIRFANQAALKLWDSDSQAELCARDMSEGMSPAVAQRLRQYQQDFLLRDAVFTESWTVYPKGKPTTVMVVFSAYEFADGRMGMMCEALQETETMPENIRSADALLHADVMVALFEESGPPLYLNPAARKAFPNGATGFRDLFVDAEEYDDLIVKVMASGEDRLVANMHSFGGMRWHDLSVKQCVDPATGHPALLVTATDVSELKLARDQARFLAERDALTNCYNRLFLNELLDNLVQRDEANGTGILYFDLDRFKQINDSFGHDIGDHVLKSVAGRIQNSIRPGEFLARLGGDEFVLLIRNVQTEERLSNRVEELRLLIKEPIAEGEARLFTSASIGAVVISEDVKDWSEAMRRADIALYASKQAGRDRCSFFSAQMGKEASDRAMLENDLAKAIKSDEFILHFQPRVDLETGGVVSAEALVRWAHPTRGMLAPNVFIKTCEENGMIDALGALIIEKAGHQACTWHKNERGLAMSVNISPRQFQSQDLMQSLTDLAQHPHFPHGKIELEITESVLIGNLSEIAARLAEITALGFKIAIDDFGTGYSNLAYISRFPLDCIKIDKSFVDQLPESRPIIDLIQTLANQIGATTVAEGVETKEQLDVLAACGCQQAQGFLFSKPVAERDLSAQTARIEGDLNLFVA